MAARVEREDLVGVVEVVGVRRDRVGLLGSLENLTFSDQTRS